MKGKNYRLIFSNIIHTGYDKFEMLNTTLIDLGHYIAIFASSWFISLSLSLSYTHAVTYIY